MRRFDDILSSLALKPPAFDPSMCYRCERCRDQGWITRGADASPCPCRMERPIEERLAAAGVGRDLLHASWDNLKGISRSDIAGFPDPDSCVTLLGPVGTGKSHVAVAILREFLLAGKSGRFIESAALVRECRECFDVGEQPDAVIARYLKLDIRVLDDAYAERKTEFADEALSLFIRRCMRDRLPLVITTNLTEEALRRIEPKVCSRITGNGSIPLDFTGQPDRRQAAGGNP